MPKSIVVVGGGIIGGAIAYELARHGALVRIVEARDIGRGATQASAGILAPYVEAEEESPLLPLAVRSLALYDEFVARVARDSGFTIPYQRRGTVQVAASEAELASLRTAAEAHARAGIECRLLAPGEARAMEPALSSDLAGALLVPAHGCVAAAELTAALVHAAVGAGAVLIPARAALTIARSGGGLRVTIRDEWLDADAVVLAAGSWSGQIEVVGAPLPPIRPVRGQLLRLAWTGPAVERVLWSEGCYAVPWRDGSLLVGATVEEAGFDERATVAGVADLLDAVCGILPPAWQAGFLEARVGLRPASPDGLPIVGAARALPGLVYATGHYRNGILLAPLTAALVAGLILEGRGDPALETTSPERFEAAA